MITATRYHDFSAGHRVVGHEGACRLLHGHNYRVHFTVEPLQGLDAVGRVLDFSAIKQRLCMWLEEHWDHKFLLWQQDPLWDYLRKDAEFDACRRGVKPDPQHALAAMLAASFVCVPFNPTAENMAEHLVRVVGPIQLEHTGCELVRCVVEETRKCSTTYLHEEA